MWCALFLALGINAIIVGAECLLVDRVELTPTVAAQFSNANAMDSPISSVFQNSGFQYSTAAAQTRTKTFKPREWMPWSLIAAGILTVVYTTSYARRKAAPA